MDVLVLMMNSNNPKADSKVLKGIIEGCFRGERKYQFKLYERYYRKMMGVCFRYASDHDEANELVQLGFIKLFNSIERYEFKGSFDGWIRRIFVNTAIDQYRKNRKKPLLLGEDAHLDVFNSDKEPDPSEKNEALDPKLVMEAINKLSPAYKAVFNLYVVEEYSHKEIAEMLDISIEIGRAHV